LAVWKKQRECWALMIEDPAFYRENYEELAWTDQYIKLWVRFETPHVTYRTSVDRRRTYQLVQDDYWLMFCFGQHPHVRPGLRGARLWDDKHVVLARWGLNPRVYFVVSRKDITCTNPT